MPLKIATIEQIRAIEHSADKRGLSFAIMMQLAGLCVANQVLQSLEQLELDEAVIAFLIGPGNNGGDGLVAAASLMAMVPDIEVVAYLFKSRPGDDSPRQAAEEAGVEIIEAYRDSKENYVQLSEIVAGCDILVDALFGIGARRPIEGNAAEVLKVVHRILHEVSRLRLSPVLNNPAIPDKPNLRRPYVIAVDCPSGMDCDTGEVDELTLPADTTVTFGAAKIGQIKSPAIDYLGDLVIGNIGWEMEDVPELAALSLNMADAIWVKSLLPERPRQSYKGTFGKALVVGGSVNYVGAPYLAGSAAYKVGAGWVTIGAPQPIIGTLASMLPEATWILLAHEMGVLHENALETLRKEISKYSAMLLGPGIGQEEATEKFVEKLFALSRPQTSKRRNIGFNISKSVEKDDEKEETLTLPRLVIDADGLNLLAKLEDWWTLLNEGTILTPHSGEFARLAGIEDTDEQTAIEQVDANRIELAQEHAKKWNTVVVLKGAFTIVASPNGDVTMMPFANPALATAGTGDVLAGAILGLVAQGLESYEAAVAAAWLHGMAAEATQTVWSDPLPITARYVLENLTTSIVAANAYRDESTRFLHMPIDAFDEIPNDED